MVKTNKTAVNQSKSGQSAKTKKSTKKPRPKEVRIAVISIFDGNQDGQQVFIDLMLRKSYDSAVATNKTLDYSPEKQYNRDKVFSDVRVS